MDVFKTLLKRMDSGQRCVLATVVEKSGDGPVVLGGKLLLSDNGERIGSIAGGALEETIIATCQDILQSGQSTMLAYDLSDCGGSVKVFYEYMAPQANLFVFGAGNVGREIIKKSEGLGFKVIVIDPVCPTGIPFDAHYKHYDEVVKTMLNREAYVVLSSSSHETDYTILKAIVSAAIEPKYLGMLASPKKRSALLQRLNREVGKLPNVLYSPIGLNIAGGKPSEIGIAVAAQLLKVKYNLAHVEDMTVDD